MIYRPTFGAITGWRGDDSTRQARAGPEKPQRGAGVVGQEVMIEGWMQGLPSVLEQDKYYSSEEKSVERGCQVGWALKGGFVVAQEKAQADVDTVPIQCGAPSLSGISQGWQKAGIGRQKVGFVNLEADPLSATTTTKHRSPEVDAAPSSPATAQLTRLCHGFELIQASGPPGVGKVRPSPRGEIPPAPDEPN
jgi:hypothetical protein